MKPGTENSILKSFTMVGENFILSPEGMESFKSSDSQQLYTAVFLKQEKDFLWETSLILSGEMEEWSTILSIKKWIIVIPVPDETGKDTIGHNEVSNFFE